MASTHVVLFNLKGNIQNKNFAIFYLFFLPSGIWYMHIIIFFFWQLLLIPVGFTLILLKYNLQLNKLTCHLERPILEVGNFNKVICNKISQYQVLKVVFN